MKKYLISIILGLLITSAALARSTGCKEGNCENGYGKWIYTDKTIVEMTSVESFSHRRERISQTGMKFLGKLCAEH